MLDKERPNGGSKTIEDGDGGLGRRDSDLTMTNGRFSSGNGGDRCSGLAMSAPTTSFLVFLRAIRRPVIGSTANMARIASRRTASRRTLSSEGLSRATPLLSGIKVEDSSAQGVRFEVGARQIRGTRQHRGDKGVKPGRKTAKVECTE
ncbi:hypothetical protein C367_06111 [Cryptococcus neoformans Ze90-1]|nr:hypothetical protein C367_06111 [Cryptococcus neoformans var. grubii Ze90-1]